MKICCISDAHLGYMHRSKRDRLSDYESSFSEAVEKAMQQAPGLLILLGDLSHHVRPDPRSLRLIISKLLSAAEKTNVVLCIGNHEIEGHLSTAYTPLFSDLHRNIHVLTTENPHVPLSIEGKKVCVHGFQFIRGREQAEQELKKVSAEARRDGCDSDILCLHQSIENYLSPYEISIKALKDVSRRYDLMLFGHVHKQQRIKELDVPAYYVGGTERTSFNESENTTGLMVFSGDYAKPEYLEVSSSKMRRISKDLGAKTPKEVNQEIERMIKENSDAGCLQIQVEVDLQGDFFEVCSDWESRFAEFTVLSVSVIPKVHEESMKIEKTSIDRGVFEEYFQKKGLSGRKDLIDLCMGFHERYGT